MNKLLAEIVQEFEPQAKAKKQTLTVNTPGSPASIHADPFQLKQALRNLVGNAIKYTPANGIVDLSVDSKHYTVLVSVKDNGYGIPAEHLPHIFDRFYRVREDAIKDIPGNGLGLAIVKSIVERHAGEISVKSEVGEGSCFTISLPLISTIEARRQAS